MAHSGALQAQRHDFGHRPCYHAPVMLERDPRDPARQGPETGANHEIQEQAAEEVDGKQSLRPVAEVAEHVDLSARQIRRLQKQGEIEGELRPPEGGGTGKYYVAISETETYIETRPTWQEIGSRGGRPRKNP